MTLSCWRILAAVKLGVLQYVLHMVPPNGSRGVAGNCGRVEAF